ncbi:hypothetical protein T492DRAFT_475656 [Pavlovales sp. CCMP2436]|nr:hypothetical protein T492DRAFT_475656 [Pavlovales sp. CCMP2436]
MWRRLYAVRWDAVAAVAAPLACAALLAEASTRTAHRDADAGAACAYRATSAIVTAAHTRELERTGFVCIPLALDATQTAHARADAVALRASGRLEASGNADDVRQDAIATIRVSDGTPLAPRRADRGLAPIGAGLAHAAHVLRGVSHALDQHGYAGLAERRVPQQMQLSLYPPGSATYRRHSDACTSTLLELGLLEWLRLRDYRERTLTAILYLNSPGWGDAAEGGGPIAGQGGELRWFYMDGLGRHADVEPRGGSLVIFCSRTIQHEVAPCRDADRYALTNWIVSSR